MKEPPALQGTGHLVIDGPCCTHGRFCPAGGKIQGRCGRLEAQPQPQGQGPETQPVGTKVP